MTTHHNDTSKDTEFFLNTLTVARLPGNQMAVNGTYTLGSLGEPGDNPFGPAVANEARYFSVTLPDDTMIYSQEFWDQLTRNLGGTKRREREQRAMMKGMALPGKPKLIVP